MKCKAFWEDNAVIIGVSKGRGILLNSLFNIANNRKKEMANIGQGCRTLRDNSFLFVFIYLFIRNVYLELSNV